MRRSNRASKCALGDTLTGGSIRRDSPGSLGGGSTPASFSFQYSICLPTTGLWSMRFCHAAKCRYCSDGSAIRTAAVRLAPSLCSLSASRYSVLSCRCKVAADQPSKAM